MRRAIKHALVVIGVIITIRNFLNVIRVFRMEVLSHE